MKTLKTSYESNLQQPYTFQGIQSYQHLWFSVCKKGGLSLLRWIITISKQMAEMLWVFFYLWYGIEYLIILCFAKWNKQNERYHDVSFEEEAHNNDSNLDYISTRKHYAWFKYIKLRSYKK